MKIRNIILSVAIGLTMALAAHADDAHHKNTDAKASGAVLAEGEIRKIDKGTGKVTIKHGPIKNLDMPPMTMVFQVKDPAMLDQMKAGDKINFAADKVDGAYTVMRFETVK